MWLKKWRKTWAWLLETCVTHLSLRLKLLVGEPPTLAAQAQGKLTGLFHSFFLFKKLSIFSFIIGFFTAFQVFYEQYFQREKTTKVGEKNRVFSLAY